MSNKTKITTAITVSMLSGMLLIGCGKTETVYVEKSTTTPKTTDAPIATPAPTLPTEPVWTQEDEFIFDIESQFGTLYIDKQTIIETGYTVCQSLRAGMSVEQLSIILVQSSNGDPQSELLLIATTASAIANFCPEQQYKLG